METLEAIKEILRVADEAQDIEAANSAALAYEEARFSIAAIAGQSRQAPRPRQPYFVQTL